MKLIRTLVVDLPSIKELKEDFGCTDKIEDITDIFSEWTEKDFVNRCYKISCIDKIILDK